MDKLIGFFVNALVIRTDLSGNPSFRELVRRVREVALAAYAHQDVPFEKLVDELEPERSLSHAPLFQAMFALENPTTSASRRSGAGTRPMEVNNGTTKFDLSLSMTDVGEGLIGSFEYNTDLFDKATVERIAGHFQRLLEAISANAEGRLSELEILSEAERRQLLVEWNDTQREYSEGKRIHDLFEQHVESAADRVAVVHEDQQITYEELNTRANQLGHYLRSNGVGADVLVGICMERSIEMIVGLLGEHSLKQRRVA